MDRKKEGLALEAELKAQHEPHISAQEVADAVSRRGAEPLLPIGSAAPLFGITMSNGTPFVLESVQKNGPVIINFVSERWDDHLETHLKKLRKWQREIESKSGPQRTITILVVSPLDPQSLRAQVSALGVPVLFGSDEDYSIAEKYHATLSGESFVKPATFLIDRDGSVRIAFPGRTRADLGAA